MRGVVYRLGCRGTMASRSRPTIFTEAALAPESPGVASRRSASTRECPDADEMGSMPPRTARRLNQLARALTLVASAVAACVCGVWAWSPGTVHGLEARLLQHQRQRWVDGFLAAADHVDPAERLGALDALAGQVTARGKLDRSLVLAQEVARQAAALHMAAGNPEAAARHARRLVAMDPRNVGDVALAVRVLGARPETLAEALELLQVTVAAVPAARAVVEAGFELMVRSGDLDGAARLAVAAWRQPASNRWQVAWSDEAMEHAWFLPAREGAGGVEARFRVDRDVSWLRVLTPEGAAMEVGAARIGTESDGGVTRWTGGADMEVRADGTGSAALQFGFPTAQARGTTFVFRAAVRPRVARWLADLVNGPAGSAVAQHAAGTAGDVLHAEYAALREAAR